MMGAKARHFTPIHACSLDELVPADRFYRHVDRVLDLSFVRDLVQDHLKAIFAKVDVCSRRVLGARIFAQQYEQRIEAGAPIDPSESFAYGMQKD
jgi:hypothetical protein